jgi:N-acetylglucosamine kinase-like BadF-type ATPase
MDLMEGLSNKYYHLFPHFALQVIDAARKGDAAACEIVQWAGEELGWLAVSVARQIGMENEEVEIVQSGSIFEAGSIITAPMQKIVVAHVPKARLLRLDGPPVVGPLMLGVQAAGIDPYPIRKKLIGTAKNLILD